MPPVDSSSTPRAESACANSDDTGLVRNTEQSAADWTTLLHGIKSPGFEHYREALGELPKNSPNAPNRASVS